MSVIKNFLSKIENDKKKQICFFFLAMAFLFVIYAALLSKIKLDKYLEFFKVEDDLSWVFQIDQVYEEENDLVIEGWAFRLWQDAYYDAFDVILYDIDSSEGYFPKMHYVDRTDVNQYFLCDHSYLQSGFVARIDINEINLNEQIFEVLIRPSRNKNAYSTGIYLVDGKMMFTNPKEYIALETIGTDIHEIVENGVLRVYRPNEGMCVYQYKNQLYWIAEEKYEFNEDGDTYIQWHLETSQVDNLPQYRLENGWKFDNLGFYFVENELTEWNTGKYRVACKELPTEYAIIRMNTGRHEGDWIWKEDFRPYYEFQQ